MADSETLGYWLSLTEDDPCNQPTFGCLATFDLLARSYVKGKNIVSESAEVALAPLLERLRTTEAGRRLVFRFVRTRSVDHGVQTDYTGRFPSAWGLVIVVCAMASLVFDVANDLVTFRPLVGWAGVRPRTAACLELALRCGPMVL
jgi:hypothetical protein